MQNESPFASTKKLSKIKLIDEVINKAEKPNQTNGYISSTSLRTNSRLIQKRNENLKKEKPSQFVNIRAIVDEHKYSEKHFSNLKSIK